MIIKSCIALRYIKKKYMLPTLKLVLLFFVFVFSIPVLADGFAHTDIDYKVCFTPPENCTELIVNTIDGAKKTIYVQAYSFTSVPIMRALLLANKRGVAVNVLLDKSQLRVKKYSSATFFINNKIPVRVDYKPGIAHNKVIIIDNSIVITGSFNFTKAAQYKNAENLLIIINNSLAKKYFDNWRYRWSQSEVIIKTPQSRYFKNKSLNSNFFESSA